MQVQRKPPGFQHYQNGLWMDTGIQTSYLSSIRTAACCTCSSNTKLHKSAQLQTCSVSRPALPVRSDGRTRWKSGQENQGCALWVLPSCVTRGRKHHHCPLDGTWATLWGLWAGLVGLELAQHTGCAVVKGSAELGWSSDPGSYFSSPGVKITSQKPWTGIAELSQPSVCVHTELYKSQTSALSSHSRNFDFPCISCKINSPFCN